MDRRKTLGIVTASAMTVIGLALSAIIFKSGTPFSTPTQAGSYTLTLNNSNGVSGSSYSGTKTITTDSGDYHVDFDYTSCSSMSGGHAVIANGGKIVNKDHIRSIYQVVANFSGGTLKFRSSYDGATWSGYTTMTSLQPYSLGSNPYYIELSASESNVNLTSVTFSYTCVENPAAQEGQNTSGETYYQKVTQNQSDWSGNYVLVRENSSTDGYAYKGVYANAQNAANERQSISISDGVISDTPYTTITLAQMSGGYSMRINSGTNAGKYAYGDDGENHMNFGTSASAVTVLFTSGGYAEIAWIGASGNHILRMNDGSNGSTATWQYRFFKPTSSYGGNATAAVAASAAVKLYKEIASVTPNVPDDETGFTATDSNKNSYTTNSIFDNDNGLVVKATFSNSSPVTLTAEQYSYSIKNSSNEVINTSAKFPAAGTYTLIVSYSSYIPVEIQLNVSVYTYLTSINARMTTSAFTTADTLSNSISGALEVDMHYNVSSADKTVYYSNLSENGLSASLLDPNGVTQQMNAPFGVAGAWKLRVVYTSNSAIYSEVTLTVSAIQVIDITMAPTSLSLYLNESANLTVTFNPTTATNKNVTWTSGDSSRVSVSGSGISATITAQAVTLKDTPVTITATSEDGNKQATCSVTVKNKVTTTATITSAWWGTANSSQSVSASLDKDGFATTNITLSDVSGSGWVSADTKTCYRLGSGGSTGSITFTLSEAAIITGITVDAAPYNNDSNPNLKVTTSANTTGQTLAISSSGNHQFTAFTQDTTASTTVTIANTATSKRIMFYSLTLTIGVANPVYPESIALDNQNIAVGEAVTLEPTFSPSDTNQTNVTWSSGNTNIATVNADGLVTGVAQGSTTITCTGHDENGDNVVGTCTVTVHTVAVTGVSVKSTESVAVGQSITLSATVSPSNATDKAVTWSSSNTSKATVNANTGLVTGVASGTAVITATTHDGGFTASCTVTVSTVQLDEWTLLFYVCGADLESDDYTGTEYAGQGYNNGNLAGYASQDIDELLAVKNQPSSVNIALETGGANKWARSDLNSHKDKLARWDITNRTLNFKSEVTYESMGYSSTLQSFLEWGIQAYPARKYGLFMWNHGGALDGCCFDEKSGDDSLTADEVDTAVTAAKQTRGISDNLEFIGYDACLMAVQDIAEINSHNFNYMIASQESEYAGGYDYDAWLPSLYSNPSTISTATLLTSVASTFMTEQNTTATEYNNYYDLTSNDDDYWPLDQTQAVYDLSLMDEYMTAFEDMAKTLYNSSISWDTLKTAINKAQKYGYSDKSTYNNSTYNYGYVYNIFDVEQAMTALATDYSSISTKATAVKAALNNLIIYEDHGSDTSGCGLNLYCPIAKIDYKSSYRATTNFDEWYKLVTKTNFGNWRG